jgi:hypothetical protein
MTYKQAIAATKKDRLARQIDAGNGWTTVISWCSVRGKIHKYLLNPEGMMVL